MKLTKALVLLLLCLLLCGCSKQVTLQNVQKDQSSMFVRIEHTFIWDVYYHKDTKVMYVCSRGDYNSGNMTVMLDADGKPLLWEGGD